VSDDNAVVFSSGPLGNFAESPISAPGPDGELVSYPTVEHYFQAWKTLDPALHSEIASADDPRHAKTLGRKVKIRTDWESTKEEVMLEGLRLKFALNAFKSKLLRTGTRQIIEKSRHDTEWGARLDPDGWVGDNKLGLLLMVVRDELIDSEPKQLELET